MFRSDLTDRTDSGQKPHPIIDKYEEKEGQNDRSELQRFLAAAGNAIEYSQKAFNYHF